MGQYYISYEIILKSMKLCDDNQHCRLIDPLPHRESKKKKRINRDFDSKKQSKEICI